MAKNIVGTGIATVAGAVAMTILGFGGILGIVGFLGITAPSKGLWDFVVYERNRSVEQDSQDYSFQR